MVEVAHLKIRFHQQCAQKTQKQIILEMLNNRPNNLYHFQQPLSTGSSISEYMYSEQTRYHIIYYVAGKSNSEQVLYMCMEPN